MNSCLIPYKELANGLLCMPYEDRKETLLRMHDKDPALYELIMLILKNTRRGII